MASIGKINLDLNLNSRGFNKQVDGISKQTKSSFSSMSVAVGNIMANLATQAVASVGKFVTDSISKGSELTELENVVESVFTTMSDQVDSFAKNALDSFGLTEKQAKKMMGTFGAMSKSFGYSEEQAFGMSKQLTSLAGDVSSFYDLDIGVSYTKLKSVFTGETESLKELGVVMTQTALDQFAMANGFGKTTKSMTEQEKVALRMAFVQDKLRFAIGDVARTQDSWANQMRKLTGQMDSFKTSFGQGLINLLSPIIKVANIVMGKLVQLANAFRSFTETIMGKKSGGGSSGEVMKEVADAAGVAAGAGGELADSADSAAGSAKKAAKSLMGFDKINKLSKDQGGAAGGGGGGLDYGGLEEGGNAAVEETDKKVTALQKRLNELANLFKNGFKEGLGKDFEASLVRTQKHIQGIGKSLANIFTDKKVVGAANNWVNSVVEEVGRYAGAAASIGATVAENLTGGVDKYLRQNGGFIKKRFVEILDASAEAHELSGKFAVSFADVFEVFRGKKAKQITADIIGTFSNGFLGAVELGVKFGRDIQATILNPLIQNKDKIKTALENTLAPIQTVTSSIRELVTNTFEHMSKVYDEKVKPAFDKISSGLSSILGTALDLFNNYIAPVLQNLADKFASVMEEFIQPSLNKVTDAFGKLWNAVSELWQGVVAPFINWCMETIVPILAPIFETIGNIILDLLARVAQVVGGIFEFLGGLIDFITGVFTGDWSLAWEGIKSMFSGVWSAIEGIVSAVWSVITGIIQNAINIVAGIISGVLSTILGIFTTIWNAIKNVVSTVIGAISSGISGGLNVIKNVVTSILGVIKNVFVNTFSGIWNGIRGIINSIIGGIETMINAVIGGLNGMIGALNKLKFDVPDWVPLIGGKKFGFDIGAIGKVSLPRLAEGGYLEKNQPTLAVVGDNKTQGEIVTPENKMLEVVMAALEGFFGKLMSMGYGNSKQQGDGFGDLVIPIYLDNTLLDEIILNAQQRARLRTGGV